MTQKGLFLVATLSWGCADIIGLNELGNDGTDAHSGGGTTDGNGNGGSTTGGETGGPASGGTEGGGGNPADGGSDNTGGAVGDGGSSNTGGAAPSGGASSGGTSSGGSDGTGGSSSGGNGNPPAVCTDDEFLDEQITEDCWQVFNTDALTGGGERGYSWDDGYITLRPEEERGWRDGDSGFFMYQEVTGNFLLEVHGNLEDLAGDLPTTPNVHGGLLLIPGSVDLAASPTTDYYAVKYGILSDGNPGYLGEYASDALGTTVATPNDQEPIEGGGVYLRICRFDDYLWVGAKLGGVAPWTPLHATGDAFYDTEAADLTPLGDTVRVGLLAEMLGSGSSGSVRIQYDDTEIRVGADLPLDSVDDCSDEYFEE